MEILEQQAKIGKLLVDLEFTAMSKLAISFYKDTITVSVHGNTNINDDDDDIFDMLLSRFSLTYWSFEKDVMGYDDYDDYVKLGYSHLFFSFTV